MYYGKNGKLIIDRKKRNDAHSKHRKRIYPFSKKIWLTSLNYFDIISH